MYKVSKTVSFAYGHRLLDYRGKCENLHGHNGRVEVTLSAQSLNKEKMVADFTVLGAALKGWIDKNVDHKVILCSRDPLLKALKDSGQACFEVQDNPTAEIMAELVFNEMKKLGLPVSKVRFWETDTSMACYQENT
ncbi:MAG: 6-carboxytetrahydropterin synthase [Elusimicrobia bacterium]|nr:6-carboxytetrahydropterin synthase [Elusimicrobiota bacterium]